MSRQDDGEWQEDIHPADRALDPKRPGLLDPDPPGWPNGTPHPAHGPADLLPRDGDGRIPVYYYCAPDEIARFNLSPPNLRRARRERFDGITPERQRVFVETLAATASVGAAAAHAGVSRTALYRLRGAPHAHAFRAAWDAALRVAVTVLADTAFERAVEGVEEPIVSRGEIVGHRRRYNDRLLMFLLRVRDPAAYAPLAELGAWNEVRPIENSPATLATALAQLDACEPPAGTPEPPALPFVAGSNVGFAPEPATPLIPAASAHDPMDWRAYADQPAAAPVSEIAHTCQHRQLKAPTRRRAKPAKP